jgi:UDP-N-acetylglucosamine transferase subunit ALG13
MRQRMLADNTIWRSIRGLMRLSKYIGEIFKCAYPIVISQIEDKDIVISHTFSFAGKVAADIKKVKQISILISPIQVRTKYRSPIIFGGLNPNNWPSFFKKNFYIIGDLFFLDLLAPSIINETLIQEELPAIQSFMDYGVSKQLSVGLWADWYSPVYEDQKSFLRLAGFPQDVSISKQEDFELLEWISKGNKPIVATLGSGYFFNTQFVKIITETSYKLNKRFIVIVQEDSFKNSENIIFRKHIDLKKVLPLCSIFIHHGGAGSCAQAITIGTPSIVIYMSHDQPDNAYHVEQNKLGLSIAESKLNTKILAKKIIEILQSEEIQNSVKKAKEKCQSVDGITSAVDILETFVQSKQ